MNIIKVIYDNKEQKENNVWMKVEQKGSISIVRHVYFVIYWESSAQLIKDIQNIDLIIKAGFFVSVTFSVMHM